MSLGRAVDVWQNTNRTNKNTTQQGNLFLIELEDFFTEKYFWYSTFIVTLKCLIRLFTISVKNVIYLFVLYFIYKFT